MVHCRSQVSINIINWLHTRTFQPMNCCTSVLECKTVFFFSPSGLPTPITNLLLAKLLPVRLFVCCFGLWHYESTIIGLILINWRDINSYGRIGYTFDSSPVLASFEKKSGPFTWPSWTKPIAQINFDCMTDTLVHCAKHSCVRIREFVEL